ncbi:glutaminase A [bacterium]|nr:glutaminase A [bacterium]
MQDILSNAVEYARTFIRRGKVATYIPELAKANPDHLGVCVHTVDGQTHTAGDIAIPFTIQSISKIFSLTYVINHFGQKKLLNHIGLEPSGNPFYSLVQLEYEDGKPRNPFINAGAIAVTSLIEGASAAEKFDRLLEFIKKISGNFDLTMDETIYRSEYQTSHRNRAVGHFMKHFGKIDGDVDAAVDAYFRQCSIVMTCEELAHACIFLANDGKNSNSDQMITTTDTVKFVNAMMTMCGLYDGSGAFACRVGLPGKSGVGGGIVAVVPGEMTIATFGPALDEKGNSIGGIKILENVSHDLGLSLFG